MRNRRKPIEKAVCSGALSVDVLLFPVNCPTQIHISLTLQLHTLENLKTLRVCVPLPHWQLIKALVS